MEETKSHPATVKPEDIEGHYAPPLAIAEPIAAEEPTIFYIQEERLGRPAVVILQEQQEIRQDRDGLILCALFGLAFAWIPIVGCMTYVLNRDAPNGGVRQRIAVSACFIAIFVVIFNIFFWPAYRP